jgi:hypothetical protein
MSYYDDPKMKLLKEAWAKIEEGDITHGAKKDLAPEGLKGTKATGTAVKQGPGARDAAAKPPAGVENLAEAEGDEDTGAPASAEDMGAGEAPAIDAAAADLDASAVGADAVAPVGSPWDQLVAAVEQMKTALEAIAAEESGEEEHMGGDDAELGDEGDAEIGAEGGEDITAVAEKYLAEAKKKLKEKEACKEGAKEAPKAFGGKQAHPFEKKKK